MQKKIPQRQCMGCHERKPKRELIRVVRGTEGTVSLDFGEPGFRWQAQWTGRLSVPGPGVLEKSAEIQGVGAELGGSHSPGGL